VWYGCNAVTLRDVIGLYEMAYPKMLTATQSNHRGGASVAVIVAISASVLSLASPVHAQDVPRAAVLLAEARSALGGEQRLAGVRTLQVIGTFRRVVGDNDTEGDFEVFIELPDNYLRSEKTGTPGQPSTEVIEALIGGEVRGGVQGGGGRGGVVNFGADGFPPVETDGDPDAEPGAADVGGNLPEETDAVSGRAAGANRGDRVADADARRRTREADVSRLLLMWLLESDTPLAWIGIAESPDRKADVLQAQYADGQPTRLFIDSSTHMPLMMQWEAAQAQARGRGGRGGRRGGGDRRGGGSGDGSPDGGGERQAGPSSIVTFDMTFFDHREVDGIRLPYVITRGADGQTTERWTISRYRVNPSLSAETFTW
jgi:hypothetical protein